MCPGSGAANSPGVPAWSSAKADSFAGARCEKMANPSTGSGRTLRQAQGERYGHFQGERDDARVETEPRPFDRLRVNGMGMFKANGMGVFRPDLYTLRSP